MTLGEIEGLVVGFVREIQKQSGREVPKISRDTVPLRDVPGFDSLNAVEVETMLSGHMDFPINEHVFYEEAGKQLFKVSQIATRLGEIIKEKGN